MLILKFFSKGYRLFFNFVYKNKFKKFGKNITINRPLLCSGSKNISIYDRVFIAQYGWLASCPLTDKDSHLVIKSDCSIGRFCHIFTTHRITIEENVLIAENVYISDNLHSYEDIRIPIINQEIRQKNDVVIGAGSWIGENVCIIGASIGKHCIIGANSVVTHDIPDYCVAVGAPAKIIKRYDVNKKSWILI